MRTPLLLLAVAALSACAQEDENASDAETSVQSAELEPVEITPGLYAVGDETTEYGRTQLNADGTYADLNGEVVMAEGRWTADGATMCFDPEGEAEDQQERCWVNGPASEDGSFLSTRDDGSQSYTVTPLAR